MDRNWWHAVAGVALAFAPAMASAARTTEPFREAHAEIREHLGHLQGAVGALSEASAEERKAKMAFVVKFLNEHIRTHAAWEEKVLYPVVDRYAGGPADRPFTSTMRYEHRIIGRWIDELAAESAKPQPDATAFARRADNVLGLIGAHFEEEEEVLLPVLDAKMSPDDFRREIGDPLTHH
jgi:hemerythrin-like domain-containing protein